MAKRGREEIVKAIIDALDSKGPLSIQQISENVHSNWSTVNDALSELKKEGKVREVVSTEKVRIFKLVRDDTYLDIPISPKGRKIGHFIFNEVVKEWRNKAGSMPTKTDVYKAAAMTIEKTGLNEEIPIVWYLYGKIPSLIYEQEKDYSDEFKTLKADEIDNIQGIRNNVIQAVAFFCAQKNTFERRMQQYKLYNNQLYIAKEEISKILFNKDLNKASTKEKLKKELAEFYFYCPAKEDFYNIWKVVDRFVILLNGLMIGTTNLNNHKEEICSAFTAVWGLLAIYLFFDSLCEHPKFKNREETRVTYFENSIRNRLENSLETLSNLESVYLDTLKELKEPPTIKYSKEAHMIRDALSELSKNE